MRSTAATRSEIGTSPASRRASSRGSVRPASPSTLSLSKPVAHSAADEIAYLFVDGSAEWMRAGVKREPVLAAWGHTVEGPADSAASHGRFKGGRRNRQGVL